MIFGIELSYELTFDFRRGATQTGFRVRGHGGGNNPLMVQKREFYAVYLIQYVSCMMESMHKDINLQCNIV